jgi:hypothetical protein
MVEMGAKIDGMGGVSVMAEHRANDVMRFGIGSAVDKASPRIGLNLMPFWIRCSMTIVLTVQDFGVKGVASHANEFTVG